MIDEAYEGIMLRPIRPKPKPPNLLKLKTFPDVVVRWKSYESDRKEYPFGVQLVNKDDEPMLGTRPWTSIPSPKFRAKWMALCLDEIGFGNFIGSLKHDEFIFKTEGARAMFVMKTAGSFPSAEAHT